MDEQTWPPQPTARTPLTEHDELLTDLLRGMEASGEKPSRLMLVKALHEATGMPLRPCVDVVESYCARNGVVFAPPSRLATWFVVAIMALLICLIVSVIALGVATGLDLLAPPHSSAQRLVLNNDARFLLVVIVGLAAAILVPCLLLVWWKRRHGRDSTTADRGQ